MRTESGMSITNEQGGKPGENEAVDGDDDGGALQVLQLGMGEFAIDLGQRFLAAHGQHGVPEGDQDAEMPNFLARSWARVVRFMNPSASELNFRLSAVGSGTV